mmetsp:Transcript_52476/g.87059  ORF Transcript_52476/g.87059 Transcript_52476/m.87059 type:complete len:279 (+) Transcript_52476:178-1014(+)
MYALAATAPQHVRPVAHCTTTWPAAFKESVDFVSLHYDCSADPDDFQSMVADRALLEATFGTVWLKEHVIPVAGTFGTNVMYQQRGCERVLSSAWGDATGFLRAADLSVARSPTELKALRAGAAEITVVRWLATLQRGGTIYIKEGGPSDFSKQAVELLERHTAGAGRCVYVVQHAKWNEDMSSAGVLEYMKLHTNYLGSLRNNNGPVRDGNIPFQRLRSKVPSGFIAAARASWLGCAWVVALEEFEKLDSWCDWQNGAQHFRAGECIDFRFHCPHQI